MSLAASQVSVGTTPVDVTFHRIKNCSSSATTIYIGGSTVTPATGYPLAVGDEVQVAGTSADAYAVVASGTGTLAVLNG